ncbi:epoxyqueuosine reductase QueH [bacterium]|nr:epoxyqueuosine reductase QueH [bacterium]
MASNRILLHSCCAICSSYPVSFLKDAGYDVVVYFYNPNIYPNEEYAKRLDAQKKLCKHFEVELIEEVYEPELFFEYVKGFENEPEKGLRCDKCFELRLSKTAQKAKELGINNFTTSIVISPHKNFKKLSEIGEKIAKANNLNFEAIDFKKKDGFLKTNQIAKSLNLYRQNYCGCKFSLR